MIERVKKLSFHKMSGWKFHQEPLASKQVDWKLKVKGACKRKVEGLFSICHVAGCLMRTIHWFHLSQYLKAQHWILIMETLIRVALFNGSVHLFEAFFRIFHCWGSFNNFLSLLFQLMMENLESSNYLIFRRAGWIKSFSYKSKKFTWTK